MVRSGDMQIRGSLLCLCLAIRKLQHHMLGVFLIVARRNLVISGKWAWRNRYPSGLLWSRLTFTIQNFQSSIPIQWNASQALHPLQCNYWNICCRNQITPPRGQMLSCLIEITFKKNPPQINYLYFTLLGIPVFERYLVSYPNSQQEVILLISPVSERLPPLLCVVPER